MSDPLNIGDRVRIKTDTRPYGGKPGVVVDDMGALDAPYGVQLDLMGNSANPHVKYYRRDELIAVVQDASRPLDAGSDVLDHTTKLLDPAKTIKHGRKMPAAPKPSHYQRLADVIKVAKEREQRAVDDLRKFALDLRVLADQMDERALKMERGF